MSQTLTRFTPQVQLRLRAQAYTDLEMHLNDLQTQLEQGAIAEQDVLDAYSAFQVPAPDLGEHFNAWLEAHPG